MRVLRAVSCASVRLSCSASPALTFRISSSDRRITVFNAVWSDVASTPRLPDFMAARSSKLSVRRLNSDFMPSVSIATVFSACVKKNGARVSARIIAV